MDDQSPYQMVNGVNSGDISPEIRVKGNNLQSQSYARGSWILNGSLSERNQSLSSIIEPGYLHRIRKYCGSDSDEISTEEDTHET